MPAIVTGCGIKGGSIFQFLSTAGIPYGDSALNFQFVSSARLLDPDKPQRYIAVRGRVVEVTEEGANDVISQLSQKYNGRPYPFKSEETRVTYKIRPDRWNPRG